MEENNFNNETPIEDIVAEEAPVEAPAVTEPVVEAPMPETKVEEVAVENTPNNPVHSAPKKSNKTVAIHSTKNVSWSGVGKVYRGYNIVTPEQAEKWLERSHVRLATPEEVAKEFNN